MTEIEKDRLNAGAKDLNKERADMEQQIRKEVDSDFAHITPEGREAIIRSRLSNLSGSRPTLVKVDLGEGSAEKAKEDLFE